jgi:hypothetical protein
MSKPNLDGVQSPTPAALIGPATSHKAAYNSFLVVLTDERQRRGADKKNTTTPHRQHSWSRITQDISCIYLGILQCTISTLVVYQTTPRRN